MRPFVGEAFDDATFRHLIDKAYAGFGHDARAPLKQLDANHFLLELFHGPTLAFKDVALQLVGRLFDRLRTGGSTGRFTWPPTTVFSFSSSTSSTGRWR